MKLITVLLFHSITPDTEQPRVSVVQSPAVLPPDLHEDMAAATVREVLYSCRENVCFVLEVYRQAFLLPFNHAPAIRKAISVYKDWIQLNVWTTLVYTYLTLGFE